MPVIDAGQGRELVAAESSGAPAWTCPTREDGGTLVAVTKGNVIYTKPDGELIITSRRNGETVYQRPGV